MSLPVSNGQYARSPAMRSAALSFDDPRAEPLAEWKHDHRVSSSLPCPAFRTVTAAQAAISESGQGWQVVYTVTVVMARAPSHGQAMLSSGADGTFTVVRLSLSVTALAGLQPTKPGPK